MVYASLNSGSLPHWSSVEALPDPPASYRSIPLLCRWHLCQTLTRHFWKLWVAEYLNLLQKFARWTLSTSNFKVGDIVHVCV